MPLEFLSPAALLVVLIAIHALYYDLRVVWPRRSTQQRLLIVDYMSAEAQSSPRSGLADAGPGRISIGQLLRLLFFLVLLAFAYVASARLFAPLLSSVSNATCLVDRLQVRCVSRPDAAFQARSYAGVAAAIIALMIVLHSLRRRASVYPLLMLIGSIGLFTIGYDAVMQRPLLQGTKVSNDTLNVLRFAIVASFAMLYLLAARWRIPILVGILALLLSFAGLLLASAALVFVRDEVIGATELYMLFIVYVFGAFSMHLMSITWMLSAARPFERRQAG